MLSKDQAFQLTQNEEQKEIEEIIKSTISKKEYQCEILNLTDYQNP